MKSRSKSIVNIFTFFALLASLLGSAVIVTPAYAAGIVVNTATDEDVANANCSLREAIIAANTDAAYNGCSAGAGADIITLPAGTYTLTTNAELPAVTSQITINGDGQTNTIIQASTCNPVTTVCAHNYRVMSVTSATGNLTLSNLTVRHGQTSFGGNILVLNGRLYVNDATISGGHARDGGGIEASTNATVNITNSAISGNLADDGIGGTADYGGGLFAREVSSVVITNSAIFDNRVSNAGGGIYVDTFPTSPTTTIQIINSTISANGSYGVYFFGDASSPITGTITNSTISGNAGGVIAGSDGSFITLKNTIIANNGTDCTQNSPSTVINGGGNIVEDNTCGFIGGVDPQLGALQNNGGATFTHALAATSPALNNAVLANCPITDQRGVSRPQGAGCDIGAYEVQAQAGPSFVVNTNADTDDGVCAIVTENDCTLREAINAANAVSGADTITFAANYTITLASQLPDVTTQMTITGNGAANTVIQASACDPVTFPGGCTPAGYSVFTNSGSLTLRDLTVQYGHCGVVSTCPVGSGAGIHSTGSLTIERVVISNNVVETGLYGGGIYADAGITVIDSAFTNNRANLGAALYLNGLVSIYGSLFTGNQSSNEGGAILTSGGADLNIANSTFSGNASAGNEGTITSYSNTNLTNVTITNNAGGGLRHQSGTLTTTNSIIANQSSGSDCFTISSFFMVNGGNNIDSDSSCGWGSANGSMSGVDPLLAPLADNGGATQTMALLAGSPAIDAGDAATCADVATVNNLDQRGVTRPQDGNGDGTATCDIGAYEYGDTISPFVTSITRANPSPTNLGSVDFTVTFSEPVTGVDTTTPFNDFALATTLVSGVTVSGVSGSGSTYTVTVNTGSGNGTIRLDVVDDNSIVDSASNPLGGAAVGDGNFIGGQIYNIDKTSPTVLSSMRVNPNPTNLASVDFTVTFSESVAEVDLAAPFADFSLTTTGVTGASIISVTPISGAAYTVTVNTGSGNGTIHLNVVDNNSIVDSVSNPLGGAAVGDGNFATGEVYTINKGGDTTGVFRPGNGLLYLKNANTTGFADVAINNYGTGGDYPIAGDWDGNGTATIGIYRNGSFYLRNSNTLGFADIVFAFGTPGDQPVAGDWDGDGVDTIGVYSNGQFLLRNNNSAGAANMSFYLGNPGDVGIAGDWNGDGSDTTGVFRPSNGIIFLKNANTTGFADIALNYGLAGDIPVIGDWNNDGIDTIGVYRNAQFMLRNSNTIGFAEIVFA